MFLEFRLFNLLSTAGASDPKNLYRSVSEVFGEAIAGAVSFSCLAVAHTVLWFKSVTTNSTKAGSAVKSLRMTLFLFVSKTTNPSASFLSWNLGIPRLYAFGVHYSKILFGWKVDSDIGIIVMLF